MIRLTVKDGSILQTLTVEGDKVFIGRLPSNSVKLDHSSVSRKHCLLRRTAEGGLELLDLNSRHGTRKNGKSVERAALAAGDEISVGEVSVTVEALSGAPARVHAGEYSLAAPDEQNSTPADDESPEKPFPPPSRRGSRRSSSPTPIAPPSASSSTIISGGRRPGPRRSSPTC